MKSTALLADIHQAQIQLSELRWSYWIGHVFGTLQWWFILASAILALLFAFVLEPVSG